MSAQQNIGWKDKSDASALTVLLRRGRMARDRAEVHGDAGSGKQGVRNVERGHLSVIGNTVCMRQCSGTDENQASIPVHVLLKRRRELVGQHARHDKTTDEVAGSNVI